ncbi:MAG: dethiobiotin synthase [Candidatus Omnitrophota bacterium]|jgi:dethiobiotin synthetase
MKKAIFITGTDTGVGKTVISGLLAKYLLEKGESVITQKWVQTGSASLPLDIKVHLAIMGKSKNYIRGHLNDTVPYVFKFPASPHLAAKAEGKKISGKKIMKNFEALSAKFNRVIVEGTGGVLVPFDHKSLIIDLAGKLKLGVLLVAGNKLGAINHTLTALESLRKRKLNILGVIFNNMPGENRIILEDNPKIIKELTGERVLGILPWVKDYNVLYKKFKLFAGEIMERA